MTKALTEMDGPSWREMLPPIPTVPMQVKEKFLLTANSTMAAQQNNLSGNKPGKKIFPITLWQYVVIEYHYHYLHYLRLI